MSGNCKAKSAVLFRLLIQTIEAQISIYNSTVRKNKSNILSLMCLKYHCYETPICHTSETMCMSDQVTVNVDILNTRALTYVHAYLIHYNVLHAFITVGYLKFRFEQVNHVNRCKQ